MKKAHITLSFRQVIDSSQSGAFEKDVFNDSYREYLLQSQAYNKENRFTRFSQLVENNPKANSLHYKTGFAVGIYIQGLNNKIPGLYDSQNRGLIFSSHRFEILDSDINDKSLHRVAITYITDVFLLLEVIGNYLLLAPLKEPEFGVSETVLVPLQKNLSICGYRELGVEEFT